MTCRNSISRLDTKKPLMELKGGGGGGGVGAQPYFFVKLDFEIAVDQQTRARDRTFEGV